MSGQWELICHHTYAGTPGVIYDLSPAQGSHGNAVGLVDADFHPDGVSPGSGSVRIHQRPQRIEIPPSPSWMHVGGLRAELTVRLDSQVPGGLVMHGIPRVLLSSYLFNCLFMVVGTRLMATFGHTGKGANDPWVSDDITSDPGVKVPYDRWVTLGVVNDGLTTLEVSIDGTTVARAKPRWPVHVEQGMAVGNTFHGIDVPIVGAVDEVKVWRLAPDRIAREFFDRPMDEATRRCWDEFFAWFDRWRKEHPDCVDELQYLIDAFLRDIAARIGESVTARIEFGYTRRRYRKLWAANKMGGPEMAALIERYAADLRGEGIDPAGLDSYRQLLSSDCLRRFKDEMPSLDCDPEIAAYLGTSGGGCCGAD